MRVLGGARSLRSDRAVYVLFRYVATELRDRALVRARSLRSDGAVYMLGCYVATELRGELGRYIATEPYIDSVVTDFDPNTNLYIHQVSLPLELEKGNIHVVRYSGRSSKVARPGRKGKNDLREKGIRREKGNFMKRNKGQRCSLLDIGSQESPEEIVETPDSVLHVRFKEPEETLPRLGPLQRNRLSLVSEEVTVVEMEVAPEARVPERVMCLHLLRPLDLLAHLPQDVD
ncbi:hypothetical protein F2Q69_00048433 [Brassica cretica]|uniref:Uncharacterized protein n=1 Tax=Brassica cretica TaxID=69181 RepID=A0A8S9PI44_BRACR|nr:hypothetical protein F2Q69_00048433 [Brassica cretica]